MHLEVARGFHEIGQLDWGTSEHAYGRARDLPATLRDLWRGDAAARTRAREWLRACVLHQGTRYPASAAVVPYLVGLAVDRGAVERCFALDLVADLAVGDADAWLGAAHVEDHAAHDAALAEAQALERLLDDDDPAVRSSAARALGVLAPRAASLGPLARAHASDADPGARATFLLCAALADRATASHASRSALTAALGDRDPRVGVVAALALVGDAGAGVREACLAVAAERLLHGGEALPTMAWRAGDVDRIALDVVEASRGHRSEAVREGLFAVVERAPAGEVDPGGTLVHAALASLLPRVFDRLAPRTGWRRDGSPEPVVRLAEALASRSWLLTPEAWSEVERGGLPADHAALETWLGRRRRTSALDLKIAEGRQRLTVADLASALAGGVGGPLVVRRLDGMTLSTTDGRPQKHREPQRRAAGLIATLSPEDAVDAVLALAAERHVSLEVLGPTIAAVVALDPSRVLARVESLAPGMGRTGPRVTHERRGRVVALHALVIALDLATRAATASGAPLPPSAASIAPACWSSEAFADVLIRWLEASDDAARNRWLSSQAGAPSPWSSMPAAPAPSAKLLARIVDWVDDEGLAAWITVSPPVALLAGLSGSRLAASMNRVLHRLDQHLADRARWNPDRMDDEIAPLAALLDAKGPSVVRALAERQAVGGVSPWLGRLVEAVLASHHRAAIQQPPRGKKGAKRGGGKKGSSTAASDPLVELSHAVVDLVLAQPLVGHLLGRIDRILTEATPTLGLYVGRDRIALLVNPDYFAGLSSRAMRVAVLRHEVLHLLFGHPFRTDLAHVDLHLFGAAADLVVNEHVGSWPLPADAVTHPWAEGPPLEPGSTLDAYYAALLLDRAEQEDRLCDACAKPAIWHSDHRFWRRSPADLGEGGILGIEDRRAAEGYFDGLVEAAYAAAGDEPLYGLSPGETAMVLGAIERRRATIAWRRVLRMFAAGSRRTVVTHTLKRRSRRYGTLPGLRVRRHHRIAVAVDTSGSISGPALHAFFDEIDAIHRAGSEVVVVECDAKVHRAYAYAGVSPDVALGRGGTAFEPALAWLHRPDVGRFDACVYLTDGHGPAPSTRPPCPLLWVVTTTGSTGPHLRFGRAVRMQS